jgi:hypothetical protein
LGAVGCRSGSGRAGDAGGIVCDVAASVGGLSCVTGVRGARWGELGGVDDFPDHCWRWWDRQSRSVMWMTCANERVPSYWLNSVCWAVDGLCTSFTAWWCVPVVVVAVWALHETLYTVSDVIAVGSAGIGGCGVAVATGV